MVGGAVRDALLGLPVNDRDWVVVGATPRADGGAGYLPVGKDFPVFLHPRDAARNTRWRAPSARPRRGYHGFAFHADAGRHAGAGPGAARPDHQRHGAGRATARLIDPFGGQRDLRARVLRHVTDAFREDPVRILRRGALRRALRRLHASRPRRMALMRDMVDAGEVDALVPERVWQELARGLMEAQPSRMFEVLRECGALARLLPEVDRAVGRAAARRVPPRGRHRRAPDDGAGHERAAAGAACRCASPA